MDVSERTEDELFNSDAPLYKMHDIQDEAESPVTQQRPDSLSPTCVSMKSSRSMDRPMKFEDGGSSEKQIPLMQQRPDSPAPTCVSMKSDWSMEEPIEFRDGGRSDKQIPHRKRSEVLSAKPAQRHQTNLDSTFTELEENIVMFVKNELVRLKKLLSIGRLEEMNKDAFVGGEEEEQRRCSRDAFLKITLNFLRGINQQLADSLQSKTISTTCQRELKFNMKKKFQCLFEGIAKAGNPTLLNRIYTELYITQADSREVNDQHEVRQIEAASQVSAGSETTIRCEDIFRHDRDEPVRTLMTKGVAGIGKTVLTQKFILDWAEDKANHKIQFIFPFTFRELNVLNGKKYSLLGLLHHVFPEAKDAGICRFEESQVLFIFDGLDESRFDLDFNNSQILNDVKESSSVEVLLTNLIRGTLLPFARVWITTRPAAANQIPPNCVDMVTEVRGFNDPQKAEYFRKRFRDEEQASRVISHIEASRSLHIMCHIPVFCWISAAVLEDLLKTQERGHLPKTLTDMYIHFLLVQTKQSNEKYYGTAGTDPLWNEETKMTILSLGKLAFEQLQGGNLIFYEADLKESGIDIKAASVYSGLFTQIFKEECGLNQDKVFSFVHLSIQEFLAALYVFLTFVDTGVDLLSRGWFSSARSMSLRHESNFKHLYQRAVDQALQSPNGHLDMFVRFLLGLSLETNQSLLKGLMKKTTGPLTKQKPVEYIKSKITENSSLEKNINLFHCLNELNDHSLVKEIQLYLASGSFFKQNRSSSQWSALVFILLSSQKNLDEFDLKKFSAPERREEGLQWLLPVVKASKTSLLSSCGLPWRSCGDLVSVLTSKNNLRELDLSDNDLVDTGAMLLTAGLKSPHCRLEILRLSGCLITEKGCTFLASALDSNPSHLRELDLSYNHPAGPGLELLSAGLKNPQWKLETLRTDNCGEHRLNPSPTRYLYVVKMDPNTAHRHLSLSKNNKLLVLKDVQQPCPDHLERFDCWKQVLGSEGLTGRHYWEVKWKSYTNIGVTYKGIKRRGGGEECCIGWNDQSWGLICFDQGYTAWHNNTPTCIPASTPHTATNCKSSKKWVAVYLNWPAGTVSFYCLLPMESPVKHIHLHTFHTTFTEPLYPVFGAGLGDGNPPQSV